MGHKLGSGAVFDQAERLRCRFYPKQFAFLTRKPISRMFELLYRRAVAHVQPWRGTHEIWHGSFAMRNLYEPSHFFGFVRHFFPSTVVLKFSVRNADNRMHHDHALMTQIYISTLSHRHCKFTYIFFA